MSIKVEIVKKFETGFALTLHFQISGWFIEINCYHITNLNALIMHYFFFPQFLNEIQLTGQILFFLFP